MAVTSAQLNQELDRWQQRIDLLSQALLKLHDHPTYRQLSAQPLADSSSQVLLDQAQQLFEQFDQLVNVIEQARQHQANGGGLWNSHQQIAQAQQLLTSASVPSVLSTHPQNAGASSTNGMSSSPPEPALAIAHITPAEAIAKLSTHYKKLWADLLQKQTELEQQATQLQQQVSQAQQDLQKLETLYNSALSMQQEYKQKIEFESPAESPPHLPPPDRLSELRQGLETIPTQANDNHWEAIANLKQWQQQQLELQQTIESTHAFYCNRLNLRKELRGRLNALQAKAQAKQKIESPLLSQLAAKAEATLYSRPTQLQQAENLVQQYEQQLNQ